MPQRTSAVRFNAAVAAALSLGASALALCVPAAAANAHPALPNHIPAGPIQQFKVAPSIRQATVITRDAAAAKKLKFKYFQLGAPARENTRDIAVGRDGNLWISTDCLGTIEKMTPKGVSTAYAYGTGSCDTSTSLTPGPDGDVWFADQFANVIGKITTKGVITTYPLPAASPCNYYPSAPLGIVAGPDGAMWFTVTYPGNPFCSGASGDAPAVGRITTTGSMTFFYTAPAGTVHVTAPERIISGNDGNLYFVANFDQGGPHLALGAISTSGAFSYSAPVGSAGNFEDTLAYGADGNLWMTNIQDAQVIKFGASGASSFLVPPYNGNSEAAYGMALGSDNALWFTTSDNNAMGRITSDGQISYYAAPACGSNCGRGGGIVMRKKTLWHTLPGNRGSEDIVELSHLP